MAMENMVTEGGAVVYNPAAGRGRGAETVAQAKALLGPAFEWFPTLRPGHAIDLARDAARRFPVVVAFGGDGTVGDVVRGIYGTDAILGILPVGTGNDVARNLGLPLELGEACRTVHEGTARRIDLGLIDGVPFINNAGTGFDSRVMQTMNTGIRFTRGRPAFLLAILKTVLTYRSFRMTLTIDDEPPREIPDAMLLSVLNGKVYGAGMPAAPAALMDDGRLDVMLIRDLPRLQRLALLTRIQSGKHVDHPAVQMLQIHRLKIEAVPPQALNIDGEVRGSTPVEIVVAPAAIQVLVR